MKMPIEDVFIQTFSKAFSKLVQEGLDNLDGDIEEAISKYGVDVQDCQTGSSQSWATANKVSVYWPDDDMDYHDTV